MKWSIKRTDWRLQALLWLMYGLLIYYWFLFPFSAEVARWHALRLFLIHILIFYVNTEWLLPRLFAKQRYLLYVAGILILLTLIYYIFIWTRDLMPMPIDYLAEPGRFHRVRVRMNRWILPNMGWSFLILFFSTIYWVTDQFRQRTSKENEFRTEKLSMEAKLLKSQINPHFLFNALNNIYSFSLTNSKKTPGMILKLSDMLRYVLYESNDELVPLSKEIWYIRNYIDFQRIKFEHDPHMDVDLPKDPASFNVVPMVLMPFIENAFKHGNLEDPEGWINISLHTTSNKLYFQVSNSVSLQPGEKDPTQGIGIENVSRRLKMQYPDQHELVITEKESIFSVHLTIDLL